MDNPIIRYPQFNYGILFTIMDTHFLIMGTSIIALAASSLWSKIAHHESYHVVMATHISITDIQDYLEYP